MTGAFRLALRTLVVAASIIVGTAYIGQAAEPAVRHRPRRVVNRGVVELVTGRAGDVSVRIAEEIAGIVDDGATRRVVPVLGKGSLQNITDLKYLRGIDLAIVPADALEYAREKRLFPGIEGSLTYIAKLYNQELHLLARSDIKTISDLSGQTVNVDVQGSGTALTATRLFGLLHINAKITNDNQDAALQKLRNGEIAALAFVVAKPAPFFQAIDPADGLHLLSIPLTPAVASAYVPSRITAADYPRLVANEQPTDTIAVGTVLVAADLRNHRRALPQRHQLHRRSVHEFPGIAYAGSPSEMAGSQYRRRISGLDASSRGAAMAAAECACSGEFIAPIAAGPLFALYRRTSSGRRRRPDVGCGKGGPFPAIPSVAERTSPLIAQITQRPEIRLFFGIGMRLPISECAAALAAGCAFVLAAFACSRSRWRPGCERTCAEIRRHA